MWVKKNVPRDKRMVALQNPKQFSGRLSFILLFISQWEVMDTETLGERDARSRNETDVLRCYWDTILLTRFYSSHLLFFLVTHCRVECNFLTLKISDWGAPTFRRQTGCRSRRERSEGWMMRKMKASKSERGRGRSKERERVTLVYVWGEWTRAKKNRGLKGRITSGILVFAFHLDEKPISRFPVFPATRTGTRIRCLLCEYTDESERDRSYILPPPPPDFVTSHIKSRTTL